MLGLASCQKDTEGFDVIVDGEQETTISVSLPEATRANSALGAVDNEILKEYDLRYILEIYDGDNCIKRMVNVEDNSTSTAFDVRLIPGYPYTFVAWADFVVNGSKDDNYYNTADGLTAVTANFDNNGKWVAMTEARDAYTGKHYEESYSSTSNITLKLKRPFAKLRVVTTDFEVLKNLGEVTTATDVSVSIDYRTKVYTGFNALTEEPNTNTNTLVDLGAFEYVPNVYTETNQTDLTLLADYLFGTESGTIQFDLTATFSNGKHTSTNFNTDIPLYRNKVTTIKGYILTDGSNIKVDVNDDFVQPGEEILLWDGKTVEKPKVSATDANIYEIEKPSELAWLAAAVNGTLEENSSSTFGTRATLAADEFAGKTFVLTQDIDLNNEPWTPIGSNGKIFKGTFDGNNKKIANLVVNGYNSNAGLFGHTTDGEIKNFTLENAKVSGRLNVGAVAGQPYTTKYTNITVQGHVEVNGMAYVGGVSGKNAYADWTNITVNVDETSYVKANSVENGTAYRTYVGGVVGFNGEGGHSFKKIESNIKVIGSTCDVGGLFGIAHYGNQFEECSCSGNVEIYAAEEAEEALEIGGIAGVWHNETGYSVKMTNCSFEGTLKTNIEDVNFYYGGLVGKPYGDGKGKLIIDGKQYVASAAELQAAVTNATRETTLYLGYDIEGDVTVVQKQGVKITIDGENKKFNGSIKVHSNSEHYADAALTIKKVKFETSTASVNFIEALENSSERYSTNITVEGCTFTATDAAENTAVGVQIKASKNAKVIGCKATGVHSLIQAQSCDETVVVKDCTINGKNGVAFKQVKAATVEGTTITATGYGIRFDGNTDNYGIVVKNNNVTANQPLIVRRMTGANNTITLEGTNTLTTDAEYQIVITNGEDDAEYVKPTGTYTLTGADDYTIFPAPFPVASWDEFTAALAAGETEIKLTADITYDANYQLQKAITLNLGGYSMTLPMINIHTKTTVKNGTINGKVYARKNAEIVFDNVKFSGAVADNLSTEGHLAIQGGCKSLYAKDCLFSPTSVSGSQTKPLSFEGGSTVMKFENCEFKSSPYKKQVYFNSLSATASLEFVNCNFNNKTPNIMLAAACPFTNVKMSGTTKLSSVTLETNRAKDAVTAEDLAYLRESLIANNSMSSVRLFYAGGSSEYIR